MFKSRIPFLMNNSLRSLIFSFKPIYVNLKDFIRFKHGCWKCDSLIESGVVFCAKCQVLQPLDDKITYFQLFGVHPTFSIDKYNLTQQFRKLQKSLHPDNFVTKSKKEQELSTEYSSKINQAYKTLQNDYDRGSYLLKLNGINIKEDEHLTMDSEFLEEMMRLNEQVNSNESKKIKLKEDVMIKSDEITKTISSAFDEKDLKLAKLLLHKLKFLLNIIRRIDEK